MNYQGIYLDHAATSPVYPEVVQAMLPWLTGNQANASANHMAGWLAKDAVEQARKYVADLIGAMPEEIFFTSGATESINWAIKGWHDRFGHNHMLIAQRTEHAAVLSTLAYLGTKGAACCSLPVMADGITLVKALPPILENEQGALVAVMSSNNETGINQPVQEISDLCKKNSCWFFCDATQSVGKEKIHVKELKCDLFAFSGHKMGGPKGIGVLFISEKMQGAGFPPLMHGGAQQSGLRAGTLNVPGIVGLGKACELASRFDAGKVSALRDFLEARLEHQFNAKIIGKKVQRVPHICAAIFPGINSSDLLLKVGQRLAISSGAACTSAKVEPSHVLNAMGFSDDEAFSALRFSLGPQTTEEELTSAVKILREAIS
jgi:cysteine desulfurase